jgi:hypothetical protein
MYGDDSRGDAENFPQSTGYQAIRCELDLVRKKSQVVPIFKHPPINTYQLSEGGDNRVETQKMDG